YQATGFSEHAAIARSILDYVLRDMTSEAGGFYCAEDADSLEAGHPKEGAFYTFAAPEILEVLGPQQTEVFNYCYGILPEGNARIDPHGEFLGKNILYLAHTAEEAAAKFQRQSGEIQAILIEARSKLLMRRDQRPRPHKDDKVLCDWNGLMLASFALAGRVLDEPKYIHAARKAADFILTHFSAGGENAGRLWHRWRGGEAGIAATLDDYAFLIYGLLALDEAAFEPEYFASAQRLAEAMIELFADPAGGFFMTPKDAEDLIMRPKDIYDGAIPSGNSVAALCLARLYALTGQEPYRVRLEALLGCFAATVSQAPQAYSFLLSALGWQVYGPLEITFEGRRDDRTIDGMIKILYKHFIPFKAVKLVPGPSPRALICRRGACRPPVGNADVLEQELTRPGGG
ncbi:MAG: thioredoxin domain-containing protein, partial [Candidatus Omnitrophica bacterium]|nr:thioredoxin domain-containing protein [Candidatus Omnitrophota bacterium]